MRRALALLLCAAGLAALVVRLFPLDAPVASSLDLARKFWASNAETRLLNGPIARDERELALAIGRANAAWPPGRDVKLFLDPSIGADRREEIRRKAAYLAAPRRVFVAPGTSGERFRIEPADGPS